MKFFLTGGGDQEHFKTLDEKFIKALPNNARILILPMACDFSEYSDVYDRITHVFESKKIAEFILCDDIAKIELEELMEFDALIFEGGNTFKLINELRGNQSFKYLQEYCSKDKLIYADSAGAIVLGEDIQTAFLGLDADEDQLKLQDYRGLGLLGDWSMHCHYEGMELEQIKELIYSTGSAVVCLPEESGVIIHHLNAAHSMEALGDLPITIISFEGIQSLAIGSIKQI